MKIKKILSIVHARNLEFIRDKGGLSWALIMPIFLVVGFTIMFNGDKPTMFKVALYGDDSINKIENNSLSSKEKLRTNINSQETQNLIQFYLNDGSKLNLVLQNIIRQFTDEKLILFFAVEDLKKSINKVGRHKIDMLVDLQKSTSTNQLTYYINPDSSNSILVEKLFYEATLASGNQLNSINKIELAGEQVGYVDWVIPGIIGINIMFGCLFGVGWVIVRYRKNGYLKRIQATTITATEFIIAQIISRLILTLVVAILIFVGSKYLVGFAMYGSYILLFLITMLGAINMISIGLLVASRISSEELSNGILNLFTFPMMLLSEIWFSLEGSPEYIQFLSKLIPLTHFVNSARAIINDGAGLADIQTSVYYLSISSLLFIVLAAYLFKFRD